MNEILNRYMLGRGIDAAKLPDNIDHAVRFHPGLKHPTGGTWPAMVCRLTAIDGTGDDTADFRGIHRTFLACDGSGKAPVEPQKMMLGRAKGACIKLSADEDVTLGLGICEGIETGLSILAAGWAPVWACGSAGTIEYFPLLAGIESLTIFADSDAAGIKAAKACQARWIAAGRECRIIRPHTDGYDWNDVGCAA